MSYGRDVRIRRATQGLTQIDLANLLGVTTSYISKIENDHQLPSEFARARFREILGISYQTSTPPNFQVREPSAQQIVLPLVGLDGQGGFDTSILPQETILAPGPPTVAFWDISQTIPQLSYFTHNFFRYFGKFPPSVPRKLLADYPVSSGCAVLDMFCGCGTTLVEAKLANVYSIGIDSNPFGILAARVKTRVLDVVKLQTGLKSILARFDAVRSRRHRQILPLADGRPKWFSSEVINDLSSLKHALLSQPADLYREFFAVAFFAIIRRVSRAYDGEVRPHINPEKRRRDVKEAFAKKSKEMIDRMGKFSEFAVNDSESVAICGDNRRLPELLAGLNRRIELIVTHPPYLNCFDYTPVYKLEFSWAGGFQELGENSAYEAVKQMEIHSWPAAKESFVDEYFGNLKRSFGFAWQVLSPGGRCCVVLGDATRHGRLIPVLDRFDQDMRTLGFVPEKIAYRSTHYGTGKYAYQDRADYHGNGEGAKKDAVLIFRKP